MNASAFAYERWISRVGSPFSKLSHPSGIAPSRAGPRSADNITRSAPSDGLPRRQMKLTPALRYSACASSIAAETTLGDTSVSSATSTTIGGTLRLGAAGAAAPARATVRIAAMGDIVPLIDGCHRRKFDVRNREIRTV